MSAGPKQTTLAGYFLLSLLLSNHAIAVRMHIHRANAAADVNPDYDIYKQAHDMDAMREQMIKGDQAVQNTNCADLPAMMVSTLSKATDAIVNICSGDTCNLSNLSEEQINDLSGAALMVSIVAGVADHKFCLGETMADASVQTALAILYKAWDPVPKGAAGDADMQGRLQKSWSLMQAWKTDLLEAKNGFLDRKLFYPSNIEDADVCPKPCKRCTKEHNSWYKKSERFSFKCILSKGDEAPASDDLQCSEPQDRNSWAGSGESKSWCEVPDWKAKAFQTTRLVANVTCGAQQIMAPIYTGSEMPSEIMKTCLASEAGEAVDEERMNIYKRFFDTQASVVPKGTKALFAVFMSAAMAEGIGALRHAVRNAPSDSSLAEVTSTEIEFYPSSCSPPEIHHDIFTIVGRVILSVIVAYVAGQFLMVPVAFLVIFLFIGFLQVVTSGAGLTFTAVFASFTSILAAGFLGIVGSIFVGYAVFKGTGPQRYQYDCQPSWYAGNTYANTCIAGMRYGETRSYSCANGEGSFRASCIRENYGAVIVKDRHC